MKEGKFPALSELRSLIPAHCFERNTFKSLLYAAMSVSLVLGLGVAAHLIIPVRTAWIPAWLCYAAASGTCMAGFLVIAHECGHRAFSENTLVCDAVGYVLNSVRDPNPPHAKLFESYFSTLSALHEITHQFTSKRVTRG